MSSIELESVDHAVDAIKSESCVIPTGSHSKNLLIPTGSSCCRLDCQRITGIIDYEPTEFTFTAKSGTRISEIQQTLEANGQYLPFDPPFRDNASTLGGSIAAGINGPSSLRFGGARDFILRIQFLDGSGALTTAGVKVVKNAAGFDLAKFMVGSYGRFGLLTELTLKVFPQPEMYATLIFEGSIQQHVESIKKLLLVPLEIDAIDIFNSQLLIRFGGKEKTLETARQRIEKILGQTPYNYRTGPSDEEREVWNTANNFDWHNSDQTILLKVPCQINDIAQLARQGIADGLDFRVSIGGQVVYFSVTPAAHPSLLKWLHENDFPAVHLRGPVSFSFPAIPFGGISPLVKKALDPDSKFLSLDLQS
ncbi:MAG: FAD-binding protein [Planctomycetota bacterium]|nr:FAD-binding protein [Planctomycetota bacterium]